MAVRRQRHFVRSAARPHALIEPGHESGISPMKATSHVQFERPRLERRPGSHRSPAAGRRHTRRGAGIQAVAVHGCGQQRGQAGPLVGSQGVHALVAARPGQCPGGLPVVELEFLFLAGCIDPPHGPTAMSRQLLQVPLGKRPDSSGRQPGRYACLWLPTLRNSITKRRASLTALSLRKAFRTSGSKRTRFVPAW
jgi:hypothetical protein